MQKPRTTITAHRISRLIAWTRLVLAWFASVLVTAAPITKRRLNRFGHVLLNSLARHVRNLIILRSVEILRPRARRNQRRNFAPAGFERRITPRHFLRSLGGSRLRRAFRHKDRATRISILLEALANIDTLARRVGRYLTRLAPIIATAPPHQPTRSLTSLAPCAADSS